MKKSPNLPPKQKPNNPCTIRWLGQAGFLIIISNVTIAIDLYLSNYLEKKYAGKRFPHHRMVPPPVKPEDLRDIDVYLCTHKHSDHMDPETFPIVMRNNPDCLGIVPKAHEKHALRMGIKRSRIKSLDTYAPLQFADKHIHIIAVPSAHETLAKDTNGHHLFLGYCIDLQGWTVYHSGDCIPYHGLADYIRTARPHIALLPVNGRDDIRRQNNIPGNFTPEEGIDLCRAAGIPELIVHHFGMFSFNTVSTELLRSVIMRNKEAPPHVVIPELEKEIKLSYYGDQLVVGV